MAILFICSIGLQDNLINSWRVANPARVFEDTLKFNMAFYKTQLKLNRITTFQWSVATSAQSGIYRWLPKKSNSQTVNRKPKTLIFAA
jgi:hypothetical protein